MLTDHSLYAVIVDINHGVVASSVVTGKNEVEAVGKVFAEAEPVPPGYIPVQLNQKRYAVWYDVTQPELRRLARKTPLSATLAPERPSALPVNSAAKRKTPVELAVVAASSAIMQSSVHHD